MTVTVQSGPSWLVLDSLGNLRGAPPAAGVYIVVLQAADGVFTATKSITINVTQLAPVAIATVTKQANFGSLVLLFEAIVSNQVQGFAGFTLSFSATAVALSDLGQLTLSFFAEATAPGPVYPVPGQPDYNEPNDIQSLAKTLFNGIASHNTMHSSDTTDWFSFTVPVSGAGSLEVSNLAQIAGSSLNVGFTITKLAELSDPFFPGNPVLDFYATSIASANSTQAFTVPAGRYLLEIYNYGDPLQTYSIKASWPSTAPGANEPNFSHTLATQLTLDTPVTNTLAVDDVDWFKVDLTSDSGLAIKFTEMLPVSGTSGDIHVSFWTRPLGDTGNPYTVNTSTAQYYITSLSDQTKYFTGTMAPAEYFIRVAYSTVAYTQYKIEAIAYVTNQSDSFDDMDNESTGARFLANGVPSALSNVYNGDFDWFRFVLSSPADVLISISDAVVPGYVQYPALGWELYNFNLTELMANMYVPGFNSSASAQTGVLPAGAYRLLVSLQNDSYRITATW